MMYHFRIRRFDPKSGRSFWQTYDVEMQPQERVLDGLIKIKDALDSTLTFRRSCAHGICGSCAMKISGRPALACQSVMKNMSEKIEIEPLDIFPLIRDLVVDMEVFFEKNENVLPYLINNEPPPLRERLQSPEEQKRILESITCIMCGSCSSACPIYNADPRYLGPSSLLKAYRFIFDSRDRATEERLKRIDQPHGIWRCHSIYNCVEVCPKGIDITLHINKLKRIVIKKRFSKNPKC